MLVADQPAQPAEIRVEHAHVPTIPHTPVDALGMGGHELPAELPRLLKNRGTGASPKRMARPPTVRNRVNEGLCRRSLLPRQAFGKRPLTSIEKWL